MPQRTMRGAIAPRGPTSKVQAFADALRRLAGRPAHGRHVTRRELFDLANEHDPVPQRPVRERPIRAQPPPAPEPEPAPVAAGVPAAVVPEAPHAVLTPPPGLQPERTYGPAGHDAVADFLRRQPKSARGRYGSDVF